MLLKTDVWSITLNGCETWTIGECLDEMRVYKIPNEEIVDRIRETRTLWKNLMKRISDILEGEVGMKKGKENYPKFIRDI